MNEFFGRLVQRAWGSAPAPDLVQPRLPSRFEMVESSAGESATSEGLSPVHSTHAADHVGSFGAPASAPLPGVERHTIKSATSLTQRESLTSEHGATDPWLGDVPAQPAVAMFDLNQTPLPELQPLEPQSQPTAPRTQIATIQPMLTPAHVFGAIGNPVQSANGKVHHGAEDAGVSSPTVERPVIQVTIGRVEVRAVSAPTTTRAAAPARQPAQSLEDYLHGRKGGAR